MDWLGNLYQRIWFATEFLVTPINRRPWTFCMRDFIFGHPWWAIPMIMAWYIGLIALQFYCSWASLGLGTVSSFVLAHVVWGAAWISKQQENPTYLGDDDDR